MHTHTLICSVSWNRSYCLLKGDIGNDVTLNRFVFLEKEEERGTRDGADIWREVTAVKASGLGTFISDLREKQESTDHMERLQGKVRAEGRQKWQPLIVVPWSLGNISR